MKLVSFRGPTEVGGAEALGFLHEGRVLAAVRAGDATASSADEHSADATDERRAALAEERAAARAQELLTHLRALLIAEQVVAQLHSEMADNLLSDLHFMARVRLRGRKSDG